MKPTANGETFDMHAVSAAHTTLPMPSLVEVTNLENGRKLVVRVNDRGPFVGNRIIDLSHEAARQLGYDQKGLAKVRVRYLGPAPLGVGEGMRVASNSPAPTPTVTPAPAPSAVASRPLAPPAPVASQPLAPVGPAPQAQSQYAQNQYASSGSSYGPTPVTYAPTAMPGYSAPSRRVYAPQPIRPASADSGMYRVQAGAYSNPDAAQRVANQLASAGQASVEPVSREGGATLYRVMLQASNDEGEAWALRDRVAELGYADARVIRPF
jgi:rare lipoprotein A